MIKIGFLTRDNKTDSDENRIMDISEFEKYTQEYTKMVRNREFSHSDIERIHELQKKMLNMLLSN